MYRSASWNRVSDEYFMHGSSPLPKEGAGLRSTGSFESNMLPLCDPVADLAKKERARVKFAENAVHVIPLVLLLCAVTLWMFSNPDVDVGTTRGSTIGSVEGLSLEGEFDNDSDGTQTGALPILDFGDMDPPKQIKDHEDPKRSTNRFH